MGGKRAKLMHSSTPQSTVDLQTAMRESSPARQNSCRASKLARRIPY